MRSSSGYARRTIPAVIGRAIRHFGPGQTPRLLANYVGLRFRPRTFHLDSLELRCETPEDVATVVSIFLRRDYGRIPAGAIVVDVGANVGMFTLWALSCGASHVFAFEPEPANVRRLRTATANDHRVTIRTAAVADRSGHAELALSGSTDNTLVVDAFPDAPTVTVNCVTLDDIFNTTGPVDVLKIDIEGGEYRALFPSVLQPGLVRSIRMEYHVMRGVDENPEGLRRFFAERGFTAVRDVAISEKSGLLWFEGGRP